MIRDITGQGALYLRKIREAEDAFLVVSEFEESR